jgi:hypothetical protein
MDDAGGEGEEDCPRLSKEVRDLMARCAHQPLGAARILE